MARNGSGTYSLPAGQPVVTGTTITAATFNTLTADLATEMSDSLSRSGKGGMTAALLCVDGTAVAPQYSYTADPDTGTYRIGANDWAVACGGVKQFELTTAAATIVQPLTCSALLTGAAGITVTGAGISLTVGTANTSATIAGNRTAADAGSDVVSNSTATRTAGNLHDFQNNTVSKLSIDFAGLIVWPSGPAPTATTPAPSAVTAITPNANVTAGGSPAFTKDPFGFVHLKGSLTNATGVGITNWVTTTPLPAGFRPASTRAFWCSSASAGNFSMEVHSDGTIVSSVSQVNGSIIFLDAISYLAEA